MLTLSQEMFRVWEKNAHKGQISDEKFKELLIKKIDQIVNSVNYESEYISKQLDNCKKKYHGFL